MCSLRLATLGLLSFRLVGFVPGFVWRALQSVPARGIVLFFYRAGIMNALDGSQDYLTYWENVHDIGDGRNTGGQDLAYVRQTQADPRKPTGSLL